MARAIESDERRTRLRHISLMIAAVASLAMVSCGSTAAVESDAPTTTTVGFSPGGTALPDSFEVPDGAVLVGSVFSNALGEQYDTPGWSALLEVRNDPFDAWDGFARQARRAGYRFPGSRDACQWWFTRSTGSGSSSGTVDDDAPNPNSVAFAPATSPDALFCDATSAALVPVEGGDAGIASELSATLRMAQVSDPFGDGKGPTVTAAHLYVTNHQSYDRSTRTYASAGNDGGATFSDDPAPGSARQHLPEVTPIRPVAGQPFGTSNDCFEAGYGQLVVPKGAAVLGDAWAIDRDFTAVIAVDDAKAFFGAVGRQLEGPPGDADDGDPRIGSRPATGGGTVVTFDNTVSGGGGSCSGQASADGRYVIFHSYSD